MAVSLATFGYRNTAGELAQKYFICHVESQHALIGSKSLKLTSLSKVLTD